MATIQVFKNKLMRENKTFFYTCMLVWSGSEGLRCLVDQESDNKPGIIRSRIYWANEDPELIGVFPDWELFIDDTPMEQKFYDTINNIKGKVIKLKFKEYECIIDLH